MGANALDRLGFIWHAARPLAMRLSRKAGALYAQSSLRKPSVPAGDLRILVLGIYLADRPNTVEHLVNRFGDVKGCAVTQHWIGLNGPAPCKAVADVTAESRQGYVPKFALLNEALRVLEPRAFDYLVVVDDDISVPTGFLEAFIGYQRMLDLALAQPARTPWSRSSYGFVRQRPHLLGRRTRFVEIGPVFSVRRDALDLILPFDESSPMGWGYDLHWPVLLEGAGLSMGIVDATPVDHTMRAQSAAYSGSREVVARDAYLAGRPHLPLAEALKVERAYWRGSGPTPNCVSRPPRR